MQGRIIKQLSNDYTIISNDKLYVCKPRGKFRQINLQPLVGDIVSFDEKKCVIEKIEERTTELVRPSIANVEQAFIITSVKHPAFSSNLLDKLLVRITHAKVKPIICFTKLDLLNEEEKKEITNIMDYYAKLGYTVLTNNDISQIKKLFKGKVTVFTGQSGAGKSTLLNKLDNKLNLKTDDISYALGRGKHTTRHVELLSLFDGLVADTPGFSSLDFRGMEKEDIRDSFPEFKNNQHLCGFSNCMHHKESKCYIKTLVADGTIMESRYNNYLKFLGE